MTKVHNNSSVVALTLVHVPPSHKRVLRYIVVLLYCITVQSDTTTVVLSTASYLYTSACVRLYMTPTAPIHRVENMNKAKMFARFGGRILLYPEVPQKKYSGGFVVLLCGVGQISPYFVYSLHELRQSQRKRHHRAMHDNRTVHHGGAPPITRITSKNSE